MGNYAENRKKALGFNPARDFGILDTYSGEVNFKPVKKDRFWSDDQGNLCIGITDLNGVFLTQEPEASFKKASREIIHIKRLANPEPNGPKYLPGRIGQGVFACVWPYTIAAVKAKKKIKTLVLTEGYIKAYVMDQAEILCIGLPGITVWKEKNQEDIFKAIRDTATACECSNIVWLTDGDTLKMEWAETKDLSKRPWSFFTSVRIFKEKTLDMELNQFWFHIKPEIIHKGIDDLIQANPDSIEDIKKAFLKPGSTDATHFKRFNVGAMTYDKIREYFGLNEGPEGFYKKYENEIGTRPFIFGKSQYQYSEETRKLEHIRAGESSQFIMVDSTYYIKGSLPTLQGTHENVLKPTKIAAISKRFQDRDKTALGRILYDIPHFDGFINRPSHTDFKQVYESTDAEGNKLKYYNKYHRLSWNPRPGEIPLSMQFIKHIFGTGEIQYNGRTINEYELGLDYIQLLYLNPCQKLPILCLVSEQGATGKTKFWEWITHIFQQNAREISSDQLTGQFTTYFASCLLCYIDEAFIDRIHIVEKLKQLVTSAKSKLEGKFEHADTIDNFLKIGLSSNNVRNFAHIRTEEMRFWVRELSPIPADQYDPDFEIKLYNEIPAFLHFLQGRELTTQRDTRLWYANHLIETEALATIKAESRSGIEIMLEMCIQAYFQNCKKSVIRLSPGDLKSLLNDPAINLAKIRWGMQRYKIHISPNSAYYTYYDNSFSDISGTETTSEHKRKSATYKIPADLFLSIEQILDLFDSEQLLELERDQLERGKESFFTQIPPGHKFLNHDQHQDKREKLEQAATYQDYLSIINHLNLPF